LEKGRKIKVEENVIKSVWFGRKPENLDIHTRLESMEENGNDVVESMELLEPNYEVFMKWAQPVYWSDFLRNCIRTAIIRYLVWSIDAFSKSRSDLEKIYQVKTQWLNIPALDSSFLFVSIVLHLFNYVSSLYLSVKERFGEQQI
jgi:hypothetical protein